MSMKKSLIAFAGAAALSALAFAPMIEAAPSITTDGKSAALAAGASVGESTGATDLVAAQAEQLSLVDCVAGVAGPFACNNVDLLDIIPTATFGGGHGSDSWGWTAEDGTEIAIVTSGNGVGFFRLEEDDTTSYLGTLELSVIQPTGVLWHDVKVVNDHAYITAEDGGYGVQIVDLTRFVDAEAVAPVGGVEQLVEQDGFLDGVQGHNMVGFPERGLVGVVLGEEEECGGNLTFYDVSETPLTPVKIGCVQLAEGDPDSLYYADTPHDAHCVVYAGPDPDYYDAGPDGAKGTADDVAHDVCALFNQYDGGVILMDTTAMTRDGVSDRATFINRYTYENLNYAHQGWFSPNHRFILFNDELDEAGAAATALGARGPGNQNTNTTTYWIDLEDLDAGTLLPGGEVNEDRVMQWSNEFTIAIDHNMYPVAVEGGEPGEGLLYQANYGAGLRVLRYTDASLASGEGFEEVAYFDTYPGPGPSEFYGAWNVYPYFESGKILLSDFQSGLLVLDVDDELEGRG